MKIAVGASSFAGESDRAKSLLLDKGYTVSLNPYGRKLTEEETIQHLQGAVGLLAGLEPLNARVFSRCPKLKAISRIGVGMDNVDLDAAVEYGIKVSNTPDAPTDAVAEMTMAALLSMMHHMYSSNRDVHTGIWKKRVGRSITGLQVLIIGYGRIGKRVAELLQMNGAQIMVYDKYYTSRNSGTLEECLAQADAVTIHAAGTDEILGAKELAAMKKGAFLLNSARGRLVDENALHDALSSRHLEGFWGDALWQEPYHGKLCQLDNAILTPHISTYTRECREHMELQAAENLLRDLS